MSKVEPFNLEPLVGFAAWHFEHGASAEKVLELFRRHPVYCQRSDDDLRKAMKRALSDLRRWQRIRHCCGWIEGRGCVSWDEAEQEMTRDAAARRRAGHSPGDRPGDPGSAASR